MTTTAGEKGSAAGVGAGTAANDNAPAFTVTRGELGALIRSAVKEVLGESELLVDKQQMARRLGCSPAHLDHLRKRGMPTLMVGMAVRFEPPAVIAWLRSQSENQTENQTEGEKT